MNITEFQIENSGRSLYHQIKSLNKFLKRGKSRHFAKCTVIVSDTKVIFRIDGSEIYLNCIPTKNALVELYFTDLLEALEKERSSDLVFKVEERNFIINERKLLCEAKSIDVKNEEFHIEAGLNALNFGEINLGTPSWQSEIYTFKSTGEQIHIQTLRKDAEKAALLLKKYKVDSEKILQLIIEGLNIKS